MFERPHMKKLQNQQKQSRNINKKNNDKYEKVTTHHPSPQKKSF